MGVNYLWIIQLKIGQSHLAERRILRCALSGILRCQTPHCPIFIR